VDGDLGEGWDGRFRFQEDDHESAQEELASVLQGSDDLTFLGQEKGGIRFPGMSQVCVYRDRDQRGFRATARISSSLHNENLGFPLLPSSADHRVAQGLSRDLSGVAGVI
jgi:hypothetical protein